jgi:hypothetical protein
MLTRWTALLIVSLGVVSPLAGAKATGASKGTETGQTAASTKSDRPSQGTTAQTEGQPRGTKAAPSANSSQGGQEKR